MALHKDLTGADLHEPKGVASATSGQVYQANGLGSGTWSSLVIPSGTFKITIVDFTSTGTWTKPSNLFGIVFHIIGGGGGVSFGGAAGAGGSTSVGTLAVVGGGAPGTGAANGAGGTLGTTPSGAKGFIGNAGDTHLTFDSTGASGIIQALAPGLFGTTLKGSGAASSNAGNLKGGGSGAYMYGWIPTATLGATEAITIGAGGTAGAGVAGTIGYCLIEQYITV